MADSKPSLVQRFNDYIADKLSYLLSIMATFYIVLFLVILPLFYVQPTTLVAWATYICSVIFQGIALPVLGYTARKAGDKSDEVMKQMFSMTKEINRLENMIEQQQERVTEEVEEILDIEKDHHITSIEINKSVSVETEKNDR